MVRGKTQMRRIENTASRQVTFSKRRNGLLKKAFELSVLCDAEVAVLVFSSSGRLYHFSSSNMHETIERYRRHTKDTNLAEHSSVEDSMQQLKDEATEMMTKIELLEESKRQFLGESVEYCSIEELQKMEQQLEHSVSNIRAKKNQVFKEQVEILKQKEKELEAENARLKDKEVIRENNDDDHIPAQPTQESSLISQVETELFIGLPDMRSSRPLFLNHF